MRKMKKHPRVSIVTCTYNGERVIDQYFMYLFSQDYPKEKLEVIIADGGSTDKTLEIIEKYRRKYPKILKKFHNKAKVSIGKGAGMDTFTRKAKGDYIVQLDQDNLLIQKSWLSNIINILESDKEISAVQSRMAIPKKGQIIDKYIGAIGIEDPFTIPYSLNSEIVFNPKKFSYNKRGNYFVYKINPKDFFYAGDNGFVIRRSDFLKSGGYIQDIDNFYRMGKLGMKVAVPKDIKLHHKTTTTLKSMIEKRAFYIRNYLVKNYEKREFYWFDLKKSDFRTNLKFIRIVIFNLLFIPGLIQATGKYIKEKELYWFIHPVALFAITVAYIYTFLYSKIFKKVGEANI